MAEPHKLTPYYIDHLKPAPAGRRDHHWDTQVPGLAIRVTDTGHRSWIVQRRLAGKMKRWTLGDYVPTRSDDPDAKGSIAWARDKAHQMLGDIARGVDPKVQQRREERETQRQQAGTVAAIADLFITKYAKKHNRGWAETERIFNRYVLPEWRDRSVFDVSRLDVTELLDKIEDNNGPVMADRTLAAVRKLFNWHATRDDKFVSPVVRGMARTKPKDRARDRTLTDDEIRALWPALDKCARPFAGIVRSLLLTGQRREEVAGMGWGEIDKDGSPWIIPAGRYKTKVAHVVPLTQQAQAIISAQPRFKTLKAPCPYVFSTHGKSTFAGFTKQKAKLDAAMAEPLHVEKVVPWTLHDLRRTARTLMTRVGVSSEHAERVLGHVIGGVAGVYDRHAYSAEKRAALEKLAAEIDRIVAGRPAGNVVTLRAGVS